MIGLHEIKPTVQKIAEAISSILEMEVIICDENYSKVGDTKRHLNSENIYIDNNSILAKVIKTGRHIIVDERDKNYGCIHCADRENCRLLAAIGIPIKYKNKVIGGMALIAITDERREILVKNQRNLLEFLNHMADLMVSKLIEKEANNKLEITKKQLEIIINSINEGVIAVNEKGFVIHANDSFKKLFCISQDILENLNLFDIFTEELILDLIRMGINFNNRPFLYKNREIEFQGVVSGKTIQIENKSFGAVLTFKKLSDIYNVINDISSNEITTFDDIIGNSVGIKETKEKAKKAALSDSTILIIGESGTGKELFARAIHDYSFRRDKPFVAINCAAIPETLLESELFGYEEGAFTGAKKGGKIGKLELANGGTVFLDEIGDMPLHLQAKLLRVLQEKRIEKLGSTKSVAVDVRIIAATNKDIEKLVEQGEFREDLYFRLNVIPLYIPPLRERKEDIKTLMYYFLSEYNRRFKKNIKGFESRAEKMLINYSWKGNVRELKNVIEYAVNMETGEYITVNSLPLRIKQGRSDILKPSEVFNIKDMEKNLIESALRMYGSDVQGKKTASKALGISMATLYRKIKEYGISL